MKEVRPMSLSKHATVALAGSALLGLLTAIPVSAAVDTTPPVLSAPVKASFTVGGQLSADYQPDCYSEPEVWAWLPVNFKWRGSDNSGSVRYTLEQTDGNSGTYEVLTNTTQTSYTSISANDDQSCGGGNTTYFQWDLVARDPAGNETSKVIYGGQMRLTQDSNVVDQTGYAPAARINYSGSWALANCRCWSGGQTHKSTAAGAAATIRLDNNYVGFRDPTYPAHVGLIMHTGPDRGKVKVYVNGVLKKTVDTFAATSRPRVMVWQASVNQGDVVKIVNAATPGRSRIDLDAVVVN
jgi:hypothetical protein